jgi:hypothetical protein
VFYNIRKADGTYGYEDGLESIVLHGSLSRKSGGNGGTYVINQGNLTFVDDYDVTFVEGIFTIKRATQTVTLQPIARQCADSDDDIILQAVSSSGLPIRFESSNPNVAIVSTLNDEGNEGWVYINSAGKTVFTAYQDGNDNYESAQSVGRTFFADLPSGTIISKWNNEILVINNKGEKFAAYQWYRNGEMLMGETNQELAIYGFVADYHVVVITTDGESIKSCTYRLALTNSSARSSNIKAYPNPLPRGAQLTIELPEGLDEESYSVYL